MTAPEVSSVHSMSDAEIDSIPGGNDPPQPPPDEPPSPPPSLPPMLVDSESNPLDLEPELVLPFIRLY
jgi:hypothetical protein